MIDSHQNFNGFREDLFLLAPHQFSDIVIPSAESVDLVRVVAYMFYQSLGRRDLDGNIRKPKQEIHLSDRILIQEAGLKKANIKPSLEEAVRRHYLRHTGNRIFELVWDTRNPKDLNSFRGFFPRDPGKGFRTRYPIEYFHYLVKKEKLSVIKIVSTIIRQTIGWGKRSVDFSNSELKTLSNINSDSTISLAVKKAEVSHYIQRSKIHGGKTSYSPYWNSNSYNKISQNNVNKNKQYWFKTPSSSGSKSGVVTRFKTQSPSLNINNKQIKKKKQREEKKKSVVDSNSYEFLCSFGVSPKIAKSLAETHPYFRIKQLADSIASRKTVNDPPAYLVDALENHYAIPVSPETKRLEEKRQRNAHKAKYARLYIRYLRQLQNQIAEEFPKNFDSFLFEWKSRKKQIQCRSYPSESARKANQEYFDSERGTLDFFFKYFRDHPVTRGQCPVFDFWKWDEVLNPCHFIINQVLPSTTRKENKFDENQGVSKRNDCPSPR